ncbi:hypothetical protein [Variovorax sp. GB1P17]|uniref:hypothetical protein n=1 Tax=Variovorax sp. GB1P17 TaxID=3443740 RepID=UPI003F445868
MRFLVCTSDATPCPLDAQQWSTTAEILDPAQFGITPVEIAKVASWGFGFVLMGFLLGYVLGLALGLIKKV